jgi:micrococcal nuclease
VRDRYGRLVGEVFVSAKNPQQPEEEILVNDELVRVGLAYHYGKYSDKCPNGGEDYAEAEKVAQAKGVGVWGGEYQRPWEFRKAQR